MILRRLVSFLLAITFYFSALPAQAATKYAPPLSFSNAQLSGRDFSGQTLPAAEFSNANLFQTNFANANLRGAVMSASIMNKANLHAADLTYAMVDQANLTDANLSDAVLIESILLRSIFQNTNIAGADFTDALLDGGQIRELCQVASGVNSQTGVSTRESLGCR